MCEIIQTNVPPLFDAIICDFLSNSFLDPPKIQIVIVSSLASWVGQAVTLKCQSDGVPTPTLTWYKPDRNEIFRVTNKEITVQVALKDSGDFGDYKCVAENGLTPHDEEFVKIHQISKLN